MAAVAQQRREFPPLRRGVHFKTAESPGIDRTDALKQLKIRLAPFPADDRTLMNSPAWCPMNTNFQSSRRHRFGGELMVLQGIPMRHGIRTLFVTASHG